MDTPPKDAIPILQGLELESQRRIYYAKAANHFKRQYEYARMELNSLRLVLGAILLSQNRRRLVVKKKDLQRILEPNSTLGVRREDDKKTGDITFFLAEVKNLEEHQDTENKKANIILGAS